jgi:ABC-2 type transport system ATP-binding protein
VNKILEVRNLVKKYGNHTAVDHISFSLNKGEIVGFLGPNGAGKSTTMKMIAGIVSPDEGEIYINGKSQALNESSKKNALAYLPENNPLYTDLYVKEALTLNAEIHNIQDASAKIIEAIKVCGLENEKHKKIGQLSKGYKQRVGLAQSILHQPDLYILDEATTGLDPNQLIEIRSLIKSLGHTGAVLISTHILQEVESICQRCIVIHKGKITADDSMSGLQTSLSAFPSVKVTFTQLVPLDTLKAKWKKIQKDANTNTYGPYKIIW